MISGGLITTNTWFIPLFGWLIVGTILVEVIKEIRERRFNKKYRERIADSKRNDDNES